MKILYYKIAALSAGVLTLLTSAALAQTSSGKLEDPREIAEEIEISSVKREKSVAEKLAPGGEFAQANQATADVLNAMREGNLEGAAQHVMKGKEAGYREMYGRYADFFEAQAKEAHQASSRAFRNIGRDIEQPNADEVSGEALLRGRVSSNAGEQIAHIQERQEGLQNDIHSYIDKLVTAFPELSTELLLEWDPETMQSLAVDTHMESMNYAYYAKIARINALIWEKMPQVVARRALTGNGAFPRKTGEVIERGNQLKIQF